MTIEIVEACRVGCHREDLSVVDGGNDFDVFGGKWEKGLNSLADQMSESRAESAEVPPAGCASHASRAALASLVQLPAPVGPSLQLTLSRHIRIGDRLELWKGATTSTCPGETTQPFGRIRIAKSGLPPSPKMSLTYGVGGLSTSLLVVGACELKGVAPRP